MKYVNKFDTATQAIAATGLVAPQVVYVQDESKVLYSGNMDDNTDVCIRRDNNQLVIKKFYKGLKMTSTGNSTVTLAQSGSAPTVDLKYSLDDGETWTQWDYSAISLVDGQSVCLKGQNTTFGTGESNYNKFVMTGSIAASGNIMSIIDNGVCTTTTIPATYCFVNLFSGCTSLTSAPELPATTLTNYCYEAMFRSCESLTTAPELPATTLAKSCCFQMFYGCFALTTPPSILPATTLAQGCYEYMFRNCIALRTAPELPATTLTQNWCYCRMFEGCSKLNYIKCLATNISPNLSCTISWVNNVAATGTFVKAASMTGWSTGTSGIPDGWTVQDVA